MLAHVPIADVLAVLPTIRRRKKRTHGTNLAEMARLFAHYGLTLDYRRMKGQPPADVPVLLRIASRTRRNWHWAISYDNTLYDPNKPEPEPLTEMPALSWYAITKG